MKRFQLCLLAVFMLLVSNCVAGSETVQLPDDQKETQVGTGKSGDEKKAAAPIGGETGVKTVAEGHSAAKPDITKNVPPQGDTQSGTAGAPGSATGISTPETQAGVETSHGAPVVGGAEKDQKTGGNPSESSPATEGDTKETKAKDDHSKSAPAAEDDRTKTETEGNPSHGAPVLGGDGKDQKKEGLTPQSAPAAEDDTTKTQLDTDLSAAGKNATLTTDGEQVAKKVTEGQNSDGAASTKQLNPQDDAQKGKPGAPGHATGSSTTESQSGVKTPESVPGLGDDGKDQKTEGLTPQGAPFTAGAAKEPKSKEDTSESSPATEGDTKETKEKDEHSKSAPATKDGVSDPKTGGKPSEGAPVVAGTTAAPAAEGKPTEGNSGSASTSTHIPTDPAKGADSQASVRAGVLSFILSIGTVIAVFA